MLVYQRVNESKFLWSLNFHRNRQGFYQYDEKRRHQRDPDAERLLQEVGFQKKRQVVVVVASWNNVPSWELTYPHPQGSFEDDLPFPVWWDMLFYSLEAIFLVLGDICFQSHRKLQIPFTTRPGDSSPLSPP